MGIGGFGTVGMARGVGGLARRACLFFCFFVSVGFLVQLGCDGCFVGCALC